MREWESTSVRLVFALAGELRWDAISAARRLAETLCATNGVDGDRREAVAIALHELLQNAVSYSSGGRVAFEMVVDAAGDRLVLSARNRPAPEHLARLRAQFAAVQHTEPSEAGYARQMERSLVQSGSGLGLARVRCESGMEMHMHEQGDEVVIEACCPLSEASPAAVTEANRKEELS